MVTLEKSKGLINYLSSYLKKQNKRHKKKERIEKITPKKSVRKTKIKIRAEDDKIENRITREKSVKQKDVSLRKSLTLIKSLARMIPIKRRKTYYQCQKLNRDHHYRSYSY